MSSTVTWQYLLASASQAALAADTLEVDIARTHVVIGAPSSGAILQNARLHVIQGPPPDNVVVNAGRIHIIQGTPVDQQAVHAARTHVVVEP